MNILFVCTGNLYRSPMCEILAFHLSGKNHSFDSCGVSERLLVGGQPFPRRMKNLLKENGYPVAHKIRSKRINWELVHWAHKIVYMQNSHLEVLKKHWLVPYSKLIFLGKYGDAKKIPDLAFVHDKKELQMAFKLIELCIKGLLNDLKISSSCSQSD